MSEPTGGARIETGRLRLRQPARVYQKSRVGSEIDIGDDFGLAAGVWTSNIGRAIRMSERLEVGTVWVNTYRAVSYTSPFGGYKQSGFGREGGKHGLLEYASLK